MLSTKFIQAKAEAANFDRALKVAGTLRVP
jgi:hypothetical protein